jgi:serine/threonine protein kinase
MECNLYELLSRKAMNITEDKAKNLFYQIMKALEYTHSKGIFHRDIKPEVPLQDLF